MTSENTVRVRFEILHNDQPIVELLHATDLGGGKFRLENSPFYVFGISYEDVVSANLADGGFVFFKVVARGGHSTYRVKLPRGSDETQFLAAWPPLEMLGCTYEGSSANDRQVYAIDVPPGSDIESIYQILESREKDGTWEFEEAHYHANDDRKIQ